MPETRSGTSVPIRAEEPGVRELQVPGEARPQRVDRFVADMTGLSRSHVQKLISAGRLTSGGLALKANAIVGPGAALRLDMPAAVP